MPPLLGRYSLWEGPCEEIHTFSDSYLLSVVPLLCQVWSFTLSTLLLPHGSLQCQSVTAILWRQRIVPVVHFLCCVSQLVLPSCLQGFYDVLRRNSQLASSIMETLLSQVKSCSMVGLQGHSKNSALHPVYGKPFRLNIGEIVLPHTGNMFECCNTSLKSLSNPCYAERADWVNVWRLVHFLP